MLGEHDKAGGVAVEAVDTAVDEGFTFLFKIPCNAVCQRIFMVSLGRVDRHSGGFVEYYEIFVFIYYINRKIDRKNI